MTSDYRYQAIRIDETTWMVRRWKDKGESERPFDDEALLRGQPASMTPEQAIYEAIGRGSWA